MGKQANVLGGISRKQVLCPMMPEGSNSGTQYCDEASWECRKLFNVNSKICNETRCIGILTIDKFPLDGVCDSREACPIGQSCFPTDGEYRRCSFRDKIREQRIEEIEQILERPYYQPATTLLHKELAELKR